MTKGQRILKRFEAAVRMDEVVGAYEPTTWDEIKREYREAKKEIRAYLRELEDEE